MTTEHTRLLFKNGTLVNEGSRFTSDLLVHRGRIERIDPSIAADDNTEVLDLGGKLLIPGMIDDQVHFREPGLTHKGNIASESRAAVAGGITSFMEMPNTVPPTLDAEALEYKYRIAAATAAANYAFYLGASNDNIEAIKSLDPATAAGVKVFMGASTGNMLVDDEGVLEQIFEHAPTLIATHCESTPLIQKNLQVALDRYGKSIPLSEHPVIRNDEACYASSSLAVELAKRYDASLHVLHLTSAREMELFAPGPIAGKRITAEVCVHHLTFCSDDYETLGNLIKCNPAIKSARDRDALRQALRDNRLDIIATDHAPHTAEEKASDNYLTAPAGLPLVQDALLAVLDLVDQSVLTLEQAIEKLAHNPAQRFDVVQRGYLREGYWADLVVIDPQAKTSVTRERVLAHCGWSPFSGRQFPARIEATYVNGQLAFDGSQVIEHGAAMRLEFARARR